MIISPINNLQTEPEWPIMEPGDGKDNNQNEIIDEDDCCKYNYLLTTCNCIYIYTCVIYLYL